MDWVGEEWILRREATRVLERVRRREMPVASPRAFQLARATIFVLRLTHWLKHSHMDRVHQVITRLPGLIGTGAASWLDKDRGLQEALRRLPLTGWDEVGVRQLAQRVIDAILGPAAIRRLPADVWQQCIRRDVGNRWWVPLVAAISAGSRERNAYIWLRMVATRTVPASCPECGGVIWRPLRYTGEFDPPHSLIRKRRVEYCEALCQHRAEVRRRRRRQARARR